MVKKRRKLNLKSIRTIEGKKHDKIRVIDFRVNPVNPSRGESVTVNMAIRNVTSKTLKSVPWQIGVDKKILHSGTGYSVPAGESFKYASHGPSSHPGNTLLRRSPIPITFLRNNRK
jgi:hypothetical protein